MRAHDEVFAEFSDAIHQVVRQALMDRQENKNYVFARWIAAEASDANLSQIQLPGYSLFDNDPEAGLLRFVPKLKHVTGLAENDTVMCSVSPMVILGVVVGNTTLATA